MHKQDNVVIERKRLERVRGQFWLGQVDENTHGEHVNQTKPNHTSIVIGAHIIGILAAVLHHLA